jgi:hypothetical protein
MPKEIISDQILMEYSAFSPFLARYLPNNLNQNQDFVNFISVSGNSSLYQLSDFLMMTLPSPRIQFYQSSNYFDIQRGVTGYANDIIEALGFFPVRMELDVLS